MSIAIVGAGFTGLTAALRLTQKGIPVTIFEKEATLGGLASTFQREKWQWPLEKHYHHWFTNDKDALRLIQEVGLGDEIIFPQSRTSIYYKGVEYSFNSPVDVLRFTPITIWERIRTGIVLLFLKILPVSLAIYLERYTAIQWLRFAFGEKTFSILWKPLLHGKFGPFAHSVNMAWFWARIKKRTPRLGYLKGGYGILLEKMKEKIEENGGKILFNTPFEQKNTSSFDAVIVTVSSSIFAKIFPSLPSAYKKRLTAIPHLHALNMLLITRKKFLDSTYWLNINESSYPFIALVQHTNLADSAYYGGNHITWIANYLPQDHPYLKMTKEELFNVYLPYLKKINPSFNLQPTTHLPREVSAEWGILQLQLFLGPFAQPVFPVNYSKIKPEMKTPIPNVYLANMDMVYPWDRGTNYAIELGERVANQIIEEYSS